MNRSTAIKTMAFLAGNFSSIQNLSAQESSQEPVKSVLDDRAKNGNPPVVTMTPWGQKIQHERSTYRAMRKYILLKRTQTWNDGVPIESEINDRISAGDLVIENPPTRLLTGVWALRSDGQQRIYLIDSGNGLLLIDPSFDYFSERILSQVKDLGYLDQDIRWVLFTHCHVDHAQSALFWQKQGAELLIHSADLNPIRTGNEITAWWLEERDLRHFKPVTGPVTTFEDGDVLRFGKLNFYVIHTPGHTPGSCCFYFKRDDKHILLSEDIILHHGAHAWMRNPYADWEHYLKSLWKVKRFAVEGHRYRKPIPFDLLLPGHGSISLDNAVIDINCTIEIVSYIINRRLEGEDIDWISQYEFYWERKKTDTEPVKIQYR